jgi:hypothetical protein
MEEAAIISVIVAMQATISLQLSCLTGLALLQSRPLSQHEEYFQPFLELTVHLLDKDLIGGLDIRVPFCSYGIGDQESGGRIFLACHEEEEACLFGIVMDLVLLPF